MSLDLSGYTVLRDEASWLAFVGRWSESFHGPMTPEVVETLKAKYPRPSFPCLARGEWVDYRDGGERWEVEYITRGDAEAVLTLLNSIGNV